MLAATPRSRETRYRTKRSFLVCWMMWVNSLGTDGVGFVSIPCCQSPVESFGPRTHRIKLACISPGLFELYKGCGGKPAKNIFLLFSKGRFITLRAITLFAFKMEDVPVSAEGMLGLTWTLNLLVFVLLVLRLVVHRRPGLNTPAIITSDILVFISWLFGISAIGTDAWKYNQEIQSRVRKLSPEEVAIARKVVFPGNIVYYIKLNCTASIAIVFLWVFGFYGNVAREGCICGLLLSFVSGSLV